MCALIWYTNFFQIYSAMMFCQLRLHGSRIAYWAAWIYCRLCTRPLLQLVWFPAGARNLYTLRNSQTSFGADPTSYSIILGAVSLRRKKAGIWIWPRIPPSVEIQQLMELYLLSPYIIIACSGTALILLRVGTRGAPINAPPLF